MFVLLCGQTPPANPAAAAGPEACSAACHFSHASQQQRRPPLSLGWFLRGALSKQPPKVHTFASLFPAAGRSSLSKQPPKVYTFASSFSGLVLKELPFKATAEDVHFSFPFPRGWSLRSFLSKQPPKVYTLASPLPVKPEPVLAHTGASPKSLGFRV